MPQKNRVTEDDILSFFENDENSDSSSLWRPNLDEKPVAELEAKCEQTGSKVVAQPVAELEAKCEQTGSRQRILKPKTGSKVVAQPVAELEAKCEQTGSEVVANSGFQGLTGVQKKLVEIIYHSCRKNGKKVSSPITISYLTTLLGASSGTLKNGILRLQKKGILAKECFKNGRGGWTQYRLKEEAYQDLLQYESDSKLVAKYEQISSKVVAQPVAELVAQDPSSSSNLINNKSTITRKDYVTEWLRGLNLEILSKFGVTFSTIARCFDLYPNLEPEQVEELIERFKEHLKRPEAKEIKNPRGFFISLTKQLAEGVIPLDDIKTPEEEYLEKYVKKSEEKEAKLKELEQKALDFEFETWFSELGSKGKNQIVPPSNVISSGSQTQKIMLKQHFQEKIWPKKKERIERGEI